MPQAGFRPLVRKASSILSCYHTASSLRALALSPVLRPLRRLVLPAAILLCFAARTLRAALCSAPAALLAGRRQRRRRNEQLAQQRRKLRALR